MASGCTKLIEAKRLLIPSFQGRITYEDYARASLWWVFASTIVFFALFAVLFLISVSETAAIVGGCGIGILAIFLFLSWLSLLARRLHDTGNSANFLWLILVCGVGIIVPIILSLGDTVGDNKYGPGNPCYSGGKFDDFSHSMSLILHPKPRLTLTEFSLTSFILGIAYNIAYSVLSPIIMTSVMMEHLPYLMDSKNQENIDNLTNELATGIGSSMIFFYLLLGVYLFFLIRLGVHRLHDTGRSGHYFWLTLFCGIGIIIPMVLCYFDEDDDNMYGPKKSIDIDNDTNGFISNNQLDLNNKDECIE